MRPKAFIIHLQGHSKELTGNSKRFKRVSKERCNTEDGRKLPKGVFNLRYVF